MQGRGVGDFFSRGAISLGRVVEHFPKIIINLDLAMMLHCKREPYGFSGQRDHTDAHNTSCYFFKGNTFEICRSNSNEHNRQNIVNPSHKRIRFYNEAFVNFHYLGSARPSIHKGQFLSLYLIMLEYSYRFKTIPVTIRFNLESIATLTQKSVR